MNDFYINEYTFSNDGKIEVANEKYSKDWPVVYLMNNPSRKTLKKIWIMS